MLISIILFVILSALGIGFFSYNVWKIRYNIGMGKDVDRSGNRKERIKTMILVAFGQKKMFSRPVPAILHFCLYFAFVITQVELLEIFADGMLGEHRMFSESLGRFYTFAISFIEILSVLALSLIHI